MTNKIKPFFIDAKKHKLSEEEADSLLALCKLSGVNVNERYNTNPDHHGIEESPYFGVMLDCTGKFETFVCGGVQLDDEIEISPEDVHTWLKYGQPLEEYNSWKDVQESLKAQVGRNTITTSLAHKKDLSEGSKSLSALLEDVTEDNKHPELLQKQTLGLLPRKQWIINRQYGIVHALAQQADNKELLNEEWVKELVDLFELIGGECVRTPVKR